MSICIIGGNERMERQYVNICKKHNCKAKVFTMNERKSERPDWKS